MAREPKRDRRKEKKSEMLDVRLPHGMKRDLQDAARQNGVTVSDAVRRMISSYIAQAAADRETADQGFIKMTIRKHPAKTLGTLGSAMAALALMFALPGTAEPDRDAQPLEHPKVVYPEEMAAKGISAKCEAKFDVSKDGRPENISVSCNNDGFIDATMNAVWTIRFAPKLVDGKPVRRSNVVYPIIYHIEGNTETIGGPL